MQPVRPWVDFSALQAGHAASLWKAYAHKFEAVQRLLEAGDTYQVNLTTRSMPRFTPSGRALRGFVAEQPVDYAPSFTWAARRCCRFRRNCSFALTVKRGASPRVR